jgi:hypothetical protein
MSTLHISFNAHEQGIVRWDPNREQGIFFEQSASLYSTYYYIQILVHRPFIPSPNRPISLPFPSLAISTNAARSCSRLTAVLLQRSTDLGFRHQVSLYFCTFEFTQAILFTRYLHFLLPSFYYSTSGVEITPQIHAGTWNMFISVWMFSKQASTGQNSGL